jgi:predicted membrane protein
MKIAKAYAVTGTLIMFLTLIYGFIIGDFFKEGSILFSLAWGKVSLIDVYIGFFLFSAWVLYREEKWMAAVLWILSIMILGNFITCLYATIALYNSGENFKQFWLGKHDQH